MARTRGPAGWFWLCELCGGRAATLALLQQSLQKPPLTRLWMSALGGQGRSGRDCPSCQLGMRELPLLLLPDESPTLHRAQVDLDVCTRCQMIFFDAGEFEVLPARRDAPSPRQRPSTPIGDLPPAARDALLDIELDRIAETYRDDSPSGWQYVLAFFVPVEHTPPVRRGDPWLTWITAFVIALVSILAFGDLPAAVQGLGFIPDDALRLGGLTLFSAFFLHGGLAHLLGNLYFLLIFGDNVEDFVGRRRFLAILLGSELLGALFQYLGDPSSTVPMIGASGGLSGLLAFYALRFPRARIGMVIFFKWFLLPAWGYLLFWGVLQVFGAVAASSGQGGVAYLAHIGGAVGGVIGYLRWGRTG